MRVRSAIRQSLGLLTRRDRLLLLVAVIVQVLASLLDLLGVLLLGLVGALAVTTVQSQPAPQLVAETADRLGLGGLSDQSLVAVLAGAAAVALLSKSIFSALITRRVFVFLANRQALVSARLAWELFSRPLLFIQSRSSQEYAYALIQGAGFATISILGSVVIVITEVALLAILGGVLTVIDPWVTIGVVAFFVVVAFALQRIMGDWASRLGREGAASDISSLHTVQDILSIYREVTVMDRRDAFVRRFQDLRWRSASVSADRTFIQQIPKHVFEGAMVIGGVLLAGVLFVTKDSSAAVGSLFLYLAAASRVMPSLLRLQGATLTLRDAATAAAPTFALANELEGDEVVPPASEDGANPPGCRDDLRQNTPVEINVSSVSITYPGSAVPAVNRASLEVPRGTSLALVGRSGAGKSTLVDVLLGVIDPCEGRVELDGLPPREAIEMWPGRVGYVPQTVNLVRGSVRDNVALGTSPDDVDDDRIWAALRLAHLQEHFAREPEGLDTDLGHGGAKLSGGQRQRIGIARALLHDPRLLVLDEATSSLDAETEASITDIIAALHGEVTTVIVAHRLSTVRSADTIAYLEHGRIVDIGTFEQLKARVPSFARQIDLMSLE